jgi:hypothetical protein
MRNHETNNQPCAEISTPTLASITPGNIKPESFWIKSHITKEYPVIKGGKYLMEPCEPERFINDNGEGIFLLQFPDHKFITFDKAKNINSNKDFKGFIEYLIEKKNIEFFRCRVTSVPVE